MKIISGAEMLKTLKTCGRTLYRSEEGTLYFNWTCSGVELVFHGTTLMAEFAAIPGEQPDTNPVTLQSIMRQDWPWLGVVLDDQDSIDRKIPLSTESSVQLLFQSQEPETHKIRIVKLTETIKTFAGLKALYLDGELLPVPDINRKKIQFIGDSITCGFGNDCIDRNRMFYSADQDGWLSHGMLTARRLGMEATLISSSGIAVTLYPGWYHTYGMDDLYRYTDRPLEDLKGVSELTAWNFTEDIPEYIILNLGTNDANAIQLMGEEEGMQMHQERYPAFLKMLRECHGDHPHIICALGSMCYYLYPEIQKAVEIYKEETGDSNISCFRYPKMYFEDMIGACGHPSLVTHEKMADAMAAYITSLENQR